MYLFFVRHFNDIDHMTPIVWRMNRDRLPVTVLSMNPDLEIQEDYRLRFLRQEGVTVKSLYDIGGHRSGPVYIYMRQVFKLAYALSRFLSPYAGRSPLLANLQKRFKKVGKRFFQKCCDRYYTEDWSRALLEHTGANLLCFDWVAPWRFVAGLMMDTAHKLDLPVLSVPHGVFVYTNEDVKIGSSDKERNYKKFYRYDGIVVQNQLFKTVITDSGIDPQKIHVLGSARYCPEWVTQNKIIVPRSRQSFDFSQSRLKVVFMTTRPNYRVDVERMLRTFELLANIEGLDVVIKPHTRSGAEAKIYEHLNLSNASDLSSVELCEWADVMLVIGSSILIETLLQGKPVLYLKYLHENITIYEEMKACWIINDESELRDALLNLVKNSAMVPYSSDNVEDFLNTIIYGGTAKRNVLDAYEQFIVNATLPE